MTINHIESPSTDTMSDKLTNIQLDIREMATNFKNFNTNFERINTDMNEIKTSTNKALEMAIETKNANRLLEAKVELNSKEVAAAKVHNDKEVLGVKVLLASEILEIKTDQKEKDRESKADRKWLIGTILVVLGLLANNIKDYI